MITDFILGAIFGGISALISLIPTWSLPSYGGSPVYLQFITQANRVFPLTEACLMLAAYLGLRVVLQSWDVIVFIYHQFWGSGS